VQRQALDLLGLHVGRWVVEVKDDIARVDLLHEQVLAPVRRDFVEAWKLLQLSLALIGDVKP
jgi:hypothetical protein